jgi:hypothetical protein
MPSLLSSMDNFGPANYYSKTFRQMIEDHLLVLKNMPTNTIRQITSDDWAVLDRYVGDFYGFLTELSYERRYHWTIMRLNGFRSRYDLNLELTQLILPDWSYIDKLAALSKEKR